MRIVLVILISFINIFWGLSQIKILDIKDASIGNYTKFKLPTLRFIQFRPYYHQVAWMNYHGKVVIYDITKNLNDTILEVPVKDASIKWLSANDLYITQPDSVIVYHMDTQVKEFIRTKYDSLTFKEYIPKRKMILCKDKNNLLLIDSLGKRKPITSFKNPDIICGDIVSRNEFGIDKGIYVSPNGNYIAFYKNDTRDVTSYPLVDITTPIATVKPIKYPMAGEKSEHVSLGVYNIAKGTIVYIEDDPVSEKYLTGISWSPDEKNIYISVLNRGQDTMLLNKYNTQNGKLVKTCFTETNPKYVEPQNPLFFIDNNRFVYQSRRDGYNHLYLYTTDGELLSQLTQGKWEVNQILGINNQQNTLFFLSAEDNPLERQIYSFDLETNVKTKVSTVPGTHSSSISFDGKYLIDMYESTTIPWDIDILTDKGVLVKKLLHAKNPLSEYDMPTATIGTLYTPDDSTELYYRLIKPSILEPGKKYPVVVYVYGGPHTQLIENVWLSGASLWDYYMAQHGYIVFTLDNRGSSNRGFSFESSIFRQLGVNEMKDQMQGIEYLKTLPFIDTTRMGLYGWSYGGFMTLSMILNYPKVFKAAVAGGPVVDWKYYEVMYGERYMDKPNENPDGYSNANLLPKAGMLNNKLLIIHGTMDPTVVWQQSQLFIDACVKANKQVDYFIYPGHEHNVKGKDRLHLLNKIAIFFNDNL